MRRLFILVLLAGCGSDSEALDRLLSEATVECGTLEMPAFGGEPCPDAQAAFQCFDSAAQPHVAQVFTTVEGDPIYEHFFIDNGVPVLVRDTRADDFGPQEITRTECSAIELHEVESGCAQLRCAE